MAAFVTHRSEGKEGGEDTSGQGFQVVCLVALTDDDIPRAEEEDGGGGQGGGAGGQVTVGGPEDTGGGSGGGGEVLSLPAAALRVPPGFTVVGIELYGAESTVPCGTERLVMLLSPSDAAAGQGQGASGSAAVTLASFAFDQVVFTVAQAPTPAGSLARFVPPCASVTAACSRSRTGTLVRTHAHAHDHSLLTPPPGTRRRLSHPYTSPGTDLGSGVDLGAWFELAGVPVQEMTTSSPKGDGEEVSVSPKSTSQWKSDVGLQRRGFELSESQLAIVNSDRTNFHPVTRFLIVA